jgi:glycerol-3-phosphate dehydrogenase (NAD(P)+)
MANVVARKHKDTIVKIWAREKEVVDAINLRNENEVFLKGVKLSPNVQATQDISLAFKDSQLVLLVVPTPFLRSVLIAHRSIMPVGVPLVCCSK